MFFWLDPKEAKGQGYTREATPSRSPLKSRKLASLKQPSFLNAPNHE